MRLLNESEMAHACGGTGAPDTSRPGWGVNSNAAFGLEHYEIVHDTPDYTVYDMWGNFYTDDH